MKKQRGFSSTGIFKEFLILTPILPLIPNHSVKNICTYTMSRHCVQHEQFNEVAPQPVENPRVESGTGEQLYCSIQILTAWKEEVKKL